MVYSYGNRLKRARAKYSTLHRYTVGGHQPYMPVQKSRSKAVSNAFREISMRRTFKPTFDAIKRAKAAADNVVDDVIGRIDRARNDPMYNMVTTAQDAADVVVNRLIGMGQGVVDAAVERLEAVTGVPVNELPAAIGEGFASYVLTGLADGLSVSQAVQRAGRKAARYGRRLFRAVFVRR